LVKGTQSLLQVKYSNENKDEIISTLEKVKDFIIEKHQNETTFYQNKIMTKQIGGGCFNLRYSYKST
jgi:hypothetical protein